MLLCSMIVWNEIFSPHSAQHPIFPRHKHLISHDLPQHNIYVVRCSKEKSNESNNKKRLHYCVNGNLTLTKGSAIHNSKHNLIIAPHQRINESPNTFCVSFSSFCHHHEGSLALSLSRTWTQCWIKNTKFPDM